MPVSQDSPKPTAGVDNAFVQPPLDDTLLFPGWVDYHLEHNPDHPFAVLVGVKEDDKEEVVVSWSEVARAAFRLAANLLELVKPVGEDRVVIGILAETDSITYCTMVLAIVRAGFVAFPMSTGNSLPALEHPILQTSCRYLFGSRDVCGARPSTLKDVTSSLLDLSPSLQLIDVPSCADLYPRLRMHPVLPYDPKADALLTPLIEPLHSHPRPATLQDPAFFLHSSGSTNLPKPIPFSHRHWIGECRDAATGGFDMPGSRWGVMGLPAFHGMGVCLMLGAAAASGSVSVMFKPSTPRIMPTSENIIEACKRGKADYLLAVPSSCIDWARDPDSIKYLATMKGVLYGGGPLPQVVGDRLVKEGVRLSIEYGSTEAGLIFKLGMREYQPRDWNYGQLYSTLQAELVPEENGLFRLIIHDSDSHPIAVSNRPGNAFDTSDLLEEHPTRKGLWRIVGRADDEIVLSNGEKTNPGPMEDIIVANPHVKHSFMFGQGRAQVGIAIQPIESIKLLDEKDYSAFRDLVWPDIERANAVSPKHSRIFQRLILVIDPKKKRLPTTSKGTVSRKLAQQQFMQEINGIYEMVNSASAEWELPSTWDRGGLRSFVRGVAKGGRDSLDDSRDLFDQGCDSLQAIHIRAALVQALRGTPAFRNDPAALERIPQNLVYNYPTVDLLVDYLMNIVAHGDDPPLEDETAVRVKAMDAMVERHTRDFPVHAPADSSSGEVVLLTGSTGSLGTYLLQDLLLDKRVERVYAVNRLDRRLDRDIRLRQRASFVDKGVDLALLRSEKLRFVDMDVDHGNFPLAEDLYDEISASLYTIIHNAWHMDFNSPLSAFEPSMLFLRWLIDLALSVKQPTPAHIIFTSSVTSVIRWPQLRPVPEMIMSDPTLAIANGYSESKWVAEQIVTAAVERRGLRGTILRLGQLSGSVQNGAWDTAGWFPLIVKTAERLGVLPALPGHVSWVPIDKAAQSILDVLHSSTFGQKAECQCLHLGHPNPIEWDHIMKPIADKLCARLVPFAEWFSQLAAAAEDSTQVKHNPAIKLLDFYRLVATGAARAQQSGTKREAMNIPDLECVKARASSVILDGLEPLGKEDVERWCRYWRARGFLI
ncbi:acetyl-CoA synthetase-like protein [Dacryopinax primogenitus]|uniref:Acetyl-CoA synthetase-like protein n=1 Tax=Dacryopinax primogenitus (strain DJM 731) TaxID=1858805 RepID=M5FQD2_DACPD|nr:acetyl-CoA synthetase-like protein [Dacryopinax primogenitus]EJT96904.1 acetyl-CoA synthetase-like protein [Dacryopinax primogenitus]